MNKKHIIAILALALCTALGIVAASALGRSGGESTSSGNDTVYVSSEDNTVSVSGGGYHVSFTLPDGWVYRVGEEEAEYNDDDGKPSIYLWPPGGWDHPIHILCFDRLALSPGTPYMPRVGKLGPDMIDMDIGHYGHIQSGFLPDGWWESFGDDAEKLFASLKVDKDLPAEGEQTLSVSGGRFRVELAVPDGWRYLVETNEEESAFAPVTIDLWPAGHVAEPLEIICSTTFFSPFPTCVPRTAIELEWEEFHGQDWDVIYRNDFRYVTLLNGGSHSWWSEYHTEATRIINNMKISQDRASKEQIVYEAVWDVGLPHAETRVTYDEDSAVWTVIVGDIFCVTLDDKGNIIDSGRICPEGFSFALTWNCYGVSSYDSATGKLVKTTDATHPEDYVTTHYINEKEAGQVWQLIQKLDIESYPDEYDPNPGVFSTPDMTLILTVRTADGEKTVKAEGIAMSYESKDEKGQKFLDTCRAIEEILTDTEEWKALPDYEFLYE